MHSLFRVVFDSSGAASDCGSRLFFCLLLAGLCSATASKGLADDRPKLRVDPDWRFVEVGPLTDSIWSAIKDFDRQTSRYLALGVERDGRAGPAMLGDFVRIGESLRFTPRFPLRPSVAYVAEFDPNGNLPQFTPDVSQRVAFKLPPRKVTQRHHVVQVYPTSARLPENLLKFYIHFSGPMSRGEAYRRVRLLNEEGQSIDLPFLELGQELWDPSGTRLTLLFDPGRVKRGLKPREDEGQVLREGQRYQLEIDAQWPDALGVPLKQGFAKQFSVTEPDYQQPQPKSWQMNRPKANTQEPVIVTFPEPLDQAMLERVFRVLDQQGDEVEVDASVDQGETRLSLAPHREWKEGTYRLSFQPTLEDIAGNSVGRAFEVLDADNQPQTSPIVERVFVVER